MLISILRELFPKPAFGTGLSANDLRNSDIGLYAEPEPAQDAIAVALEAYQVIDAWDGKNDVELSSKAAALIEALARKRVEEAADRWEYLVYWGLPNISLDNLREYANPEQLEEIKSGRAAIIGKEGACAW